MNVSSLFKQLKKRLRWKRRWLSLGAIVLLSAAIWLEASIVDNEIEQLPVEPISESVAALNQEPGNVIIKENTYFGLDDDGNLSMYDGLPSEKKVIRSFFQLDIEYLESSLPREMVEQLYEGIQITDFAEYNSVLSTFSDFAVDITEEVMKSTP